MKKINFVLLAIFGFAVSAYAQSFEFQVEHEHSFRNCRGKLFITADKIEYRTDQRHDSRSWQYNELRQIKVLSATSLELVTYEDQVRLAGRDRIFKFNLLTEKITSELSELLMKNATRPIVNSVLLPESEKPQFTVPVKHLRVLKGSLGTLKIYRDRIIYEAADNPAESRYWRYYEIQNFSHSERYNFEIVSYEDSIGGLKTYNFQLREELPPNAYDYIWSRVYPTKFQRTEKTSPTK